MSPRRLRANTVLPAPMNVIFAMGEQATTARAAPGPLARIGHKSTLPVDERTVTRRVFDGDLPDEEPTTMTRRVTRRQEHAIRPPGPADVAAGSTLVEVLVAIVHHELGVIVLVTGMGTLFASSIQNRQSTTASVVARDYAEALVVAVAQLSAANPWCSTTGYTSAYTAARRLRGRRGRPRVPRHHRRTTPQFQTVTITVTAPIGRTETLDIVVRPT